MGPRGAVADVARDLAWLAFVAFLLHGNWEWLQTFFYVDATSEIDTIVWYRLHCTLVDVAILAGAAAIVALSRRDPRWVEHPSRRDLVLLAVLGVAYTSISEQVNVAMTGAWGYSTLMPVIPGTSIGLAPLLQWVVIPPVAVLLAARLIGGRASRGHPPLPGR